MGQGAGQLVGRKLYVGAKNLSYSTRLEEASNGKQHPESYSRFSLFIASHCYFGKISVRNFERTTPTLRSDLNLFFHTYVYGC